MLRTALSHPQCETLLKDQEGRKNGATGDEDEAAKVREELAALHETLDGVRQRTRIDIENLQADLIAKNREIDKLNRQLSEYLDPDSVEGKDVQALLDLWWREVKNSDPRVHHGLDSTRAPRVRAAVKRRAKRRKGGDDNGGVEICRKAVLGVLYDDWAMGRVAKTQGKTFNDIAEHILNTDGDIERFATLYDDCHVTAPDVYQRMIDAGIEPPERPHPMQIALEGLRRLGCDWRESSTPGQYVAECPLHDDAPRSLYVRMAFGRCRMVCSYGCSEYVLLTAAGFTGPSDWIESPHPARETAAFSDVDEVTP
jgi:hypothetical protein